MGISTEIICVSSLGMVASLGLSATTVCAAARAGLTRPSELESYPVRSPEDGAVQGVVVHAIPEVTRGFEGFARQLRILQATFLDLERQTPHAPWNDSAMPVYFSLPDLGRPFSCAELIPDEADRKASEEEARAFSEQAKSDHRAARLLKAVAPLCGWKCEPSTRFVSTAGHTGVAEALGQALNDLRSKQTPVAIVVGLDSLLEISTLDWLERRGRLKTPSTPTGLPPGEAGVALMLEPLAVVLARGGTPLGVIESVQFADESNHLITGAPPLGRGIAELLVRERDHVATEGPPWVVCDQNGEDYRALEWGNSLVRLVAECDAFGQCQVWYPAASFGDTGAASSAVGVVMALTALQRGYAPAPRAMVLSASDSPKRALTVLRAHSA